MPCLDDYTKKREEIWIGEQIRGMKPKEKEEFLEECTFFLLYVDEYTKDPTGKYI